jgi:hypothetical protein
VFIVTQCSIRNSLSRAIGSRLKRLHGGPCSADRTLSTPIRKLAVQSALLHGPRAPGRGAQSLRRSRGVPEPSRAPGSRAPHSDYGRAWAGVIFELPWFSQQWRFRGPFFPRMRCRDHCTPRNHDPVEVDRLCFKKMKRSPHLGDLAALAVRCLRKRLHQAVVDMLGKYEAGLT